MTRLHSSNHQIKITTTNKTALSCFDDKRFILANGVDTFPYGHYSLQQKPSNSKLSSDGCADVVDVDYDSCDSTDEEDQLSELSSFDLEPVSGSSSSSSFGFGYFTLFYLKYRFLILLCFSRT